MNSRAKIIDVMIISFLLMDNERWDSSIVSYGYRATNKKEDSAKKDDREPVKKNVSLSNFRRHHICLPQLSEAPANIMSSGPHDYFGRGLCTPGDDATVDDIQACTYRSPISLSSHFCTHSCTQQHESRAEARHLGRPH